jgi:hypothetical protein
VNEPSSDLQFIAQMLMKTRSGNQITTAEAERLESVATYGYSVVPPIATIATPEEQRGQI